MSESAIALWGAGRVPPAPAPALPIETRGLTLRAGDRTLIDGIDLALRGAGISVVMGANGAGKSLLLRLLHGLISPSAGEISIGGAQLDAPQRARQAMVFQTPVLLRRSVAANVDFGLRARGRRDRAFRDALLAHVDLADRASLPARSLSGGEKQRLALARALATEPATLFLDEPTASLDPASVAKIEAIVRASRACGTKIVFVTHDIAQARRLADDVLFLHRGRLVEHAAAARFFDRPDAAVARDYLAGRLLT